MDSKFDGQKGWANHITGCRRNGDNPVTTAGQAVFWTVAAADFGPGSPRGCLGEGLGGKGCTFGVQARRKRSVVPLFRGKLRKTVAILFQSRHWFVT